MNFVRSIWLWINKSSNNTVAVYQSDDSDDENKPLYVNQLTKIKELEVKYGPDEIHIKNLRTAEIKSLAYIGCGAFSVVKKGFSEKYNCDIAVKIILLKEEASKSYREKYLPREIALWKELSLEGHENILNIKEDIWSDEYLYVITDVADRGNLSNLLLSGCSTENKAKSIFRDIVCATAYCHGKRIAHRDIKPANLLLGRDDRIKLADFSFVTRENPVYKDRCGTADMLSPEQNVKGEYDPFISDIWQAGLTLYMTLFKKLPYRNRKRGDIEFEMKGLRNHYKGVPFPKNKVISIDCKELIAGMLNVNPRIRMSIEEVKRSSWLTASYKLSSSLIDKKEVSSKETIRVEERKDDKTETD